MADDPTAVFTRPDVAAAVAGQAPPAAPAMTDAEALDQVAAVLGLYTTDPANNPVEEILADIVGYVQQTGRATDVPEGA